MEHFGRWRLAMLLCVFVLSLTWDVKARAQDFNANIERETESFLPDIPDEKLERSVTIVNQPVYRFEPTFFNKDVAKTPADKQGEVWSLIEKRRGSQFPMSLPLSDFQKLFPGENQASRKSEGTFSEEDAQFILDQLGEPSLLKEDGDTQPIINNLLVAPLSARGKLGFMRDVDVKMTSTNSLDAIMVRFGIPLFKTVRARGKSKRVQVGTKQKRIVGGRKSKLTFTPSGGPTFRSNAFSANDARQDSVAAFGGSLAFTIPIGDNDDTLTLATSQSFTRYDNFEDRNRDLYFGGLTYTQYTGRKFWVDGIQESIQYAIGHRSIWRSGFEGIPVTLSVPSVTYELSGIPLTNKKLCGKPEKPKPCTTGTISAGLQHTFSNLSSIDNTQAGVSVKLSHSLPKQKLSISLTTGLSGSIRTNVAGGRQDLYFSSKARVGWTGLDNAELSAEVEYVRNQSTLSINNYENVDVRPRVRLTIPLGEWERKVINR